MEIISFVGSSSAVRKSTGFNLHFSTMRFKSARRLPVSGKSIQGTRSMPRKEKIRSVSVGEKKSLVEILSFALILLAVPLAVFKIAPEFDGTFSQVRFNDSAVSELDFLNTALAKFAMEDVLSEVDENGNVLSSDGAVIPHANFVQTVSFQNYKVQPGDSISTISRKFALSNISTLIAVNNIENVRSLRAGQTLRIPSMDGLVYKVQNGDSLNALSVKFQVSVEEILDANDLSSEVLSKGMELFIPGAKMSSSELKKAMGELFVYPITAAWRLTSRFGPRKDPFTGVASNHTGVDMACPQGTPIRAAMSGKVVYVGWSNIFGNYVIINHGNGYQSLYGHMLKPLVKNGQSVDQSTRIGLVGSTGYSTGPHLHFTVYKNGKLVDPLTLLKK